MRVQCLQCAAYCIATWYDTHTLQDQGLFLQQLMKLIITFYEFFSILKNIHPSKLSTRNEKLAVG